MIEAEAKLDEVNCLLRLGAQALQIQCNENYINDKQLKGENPGESWADSNFQCINVLIDVIYILGCSMCYFFLADAWTNPN